jgi:hypothetical protein
MDPAALRLPQVVQQAQMELVTGRQFCNLDGLMQLAMMDINNLKFITGAIVADFLKRQVQELLCQLVFEPFGDSHGADRLLSSLGLSV